VIFFFLEKVNGLGELKKVFLADGAILNVRPRNLTRIQVAITGVAKMGDVEGLEVQVAVGEAGVTVLRIGRVVARLSISRSTVYDWMNPKSPRYDPTFPIPIRLSASKNTGAVGWLESEIYIWLESRLNASRRKEGGK